MSTAATSDVAGVAIIGMAGRFPGAATLEQFWINLRDGVESISRLSDEQLLAAGVAPETLADPSYVRAAPLLDGVDLFDASFFGFSAREAEVLDPQQRVFLELAWTALESAGYVPELYPGAIGLFAGAGMSAYLWANLSRRPDVVRAHGTLAILLGNEKDYLATRTSYALNMRGPSIGVQTACSTSLVAVHLACQALLDYHCDMALAGGVRIAVPQIEGYHYEEGGISSRDGHCRAFAAGASGTVFGSGAGVVLLKRLDEALADGDSVRAVIRGTAVNNDGARKVGYTAPGVEGQIGVIAEALAAAGVEPDSISYVEGHGTGTPLGDPIEVEALTRAFRRRTGRAGFCAFGSVKSNVGHLDTAAGIAGLIKTVLALEQRQIPPSLHFAAPNPEIDFAASPFFVNDRLREWQQGGGPRRAAVSSFGIGGTNAHLVVEEAPTPPPPAAARRWQLLLLSARTPAALDQASAALAARLHELPEEALPDVAFTLLAGRRRFEHRRALVCRGTGEAAAALAGRDAARLFSHAEPRGSRALAFLFPGQGAQHPGMGRELYLGEAVFRRALDRCAEVLAPALGVDLRLVLYPAADADGAGAAERLRRTDLAQPALFAIEYALARLWMSWGVVPRAMLGHSVGEYVAACLAGVFAVEDALSLVAARGRLMAALPEGAMLAVPLGAPEALALLGPGLDLAAVNGAAWCVLSGSVAAVEGCRAELAARGLDARRLHTSHAFHSASMDPILEPFAREVERTPKAAPRIPFVSNLTGTWISAEEATDPRYWVRHLRRPVLFGAGLETLLAEPGRVLLEVGPGEALCTLARRHPHRGSAHAVVASLRRRPGQGNAGDDLESLLHAAARLWLVGIETGVAEFFAGERRRRLPLPTYPFERQRYWIDPPAAQEEATATAMPPLTTPPKAARPAPPGTGAHGAGPVHSRPALATAYAAPRDEAERRLAVLWGERLGIERVGIHDDFFELGGHSLLATRIAADVRRSEGADVTMRDLFATPTVAHMAAAVAARAAAGAASSPLPTLAADPASAHLPFPLTDVQGAYWIGRGSAFALGGVATHTYFELEGEGIDLARWQRALRLLIARHGMLRAVVLADGRQQVLPEVPPYTVGVLDLQGLEPGAALEQVLALRARMSHQVLPAGCWPLFEIRATRFAGGRLRLHVSFDFLIGDAWSVRLLAADLRRLYSDAETAPLPPAATFREYVLAAAALGESDLFRRSLEYWHGRLDTLPPPPELPLLALPAGRERPLFVRRSGGLPAAAWERLKAAAARVGLTPSAVVLAAFAEALAAWSKRPRFTLNLTLFNRLPLHPEVDGIVGDFTSLTLLEIDAASAAIFEERARLLQQRLWSDLDHRYVSGVRVLRDLARRRREPAAAPVVFTSTLGLSAGAAAPPGDAGADPGELRQVYGVSQTPQVWLDHQVGEREGALVFNWDAVEELFPVAMLDDMMAAYAALLERLAAGEEAWREASPLPLPAAHLALYAAANDTASPLPGGLLQGPFLAQAERQPERPAVISAARRLSYGELRLLAAGVGRRLRRHGVEAGTLVGVVMSKGWEQVAAVLGVLEAGAAYLPVDAELPRQRRDELLREGGVRLALTQPSWAAALEWPPDMEVLAVEGEGEAGGQEGQPEPSPHQGNGAALAYTLFTSGSTGVPKGVMIEHGAALNTVVDVNRRFAVGSLDRVLALSSLSFDLSVYDVFGLLGAGGAVVLPEAAAGRDPGRWLELMAGEGVTVWNTVPALLEMLVEHAVGRGLTLPPSLRLVLLSGDWVPVGLAARVRGLCPGEVEVVSLGGATEASIWSILYPVGKVERNWRSIPYGRAMVNQTVEVLDERLEPRPLWVAGDLYVGGAGLARGYWGDAVKTAASFVVHPRRGDRLYRTGDHGRWLPDGNVEFLGRDDGQVKIQGHRIELGEIEAALARCPGVRLAAAATLAAPESPAQTAAPRRSRRLVGYVVLEPGCAVLAEDLRANLAATLPAYMVPSAFLVLDALPLTANGKVDRHALPAPEGEPGAGRTTEAGPLTPVGELMAAIWEEVLGVTGVDGRDDFYGLGGDSLLATRVASRVRERFGVELPLRDFFAEPTLAGQARAVEAARGVKAAQAPPLVAQPRVREAPLSFAQERLWFLDRLEPGSPAYNEDFTLRVAGALDPAVLAASLMEVVRRHEALRTTFAERDGLPVQVVGPPERVGVAVADLRTLDEDRRLPEALRHGARVARQPFDLACGPLLRLALQRIGEEEHLLVLVLHHIVCDAWSMGLLVREVLAVYGAVKARRASPLPELAVQYADFAIWQRLWLNAPAGGNAAAGGPATPLDVQIAYWRQRLAGLGPALRLPTRPRPAISSRRAANRSAPLPSGLVEQLRALGRREGATLFMTLLAALQVLLHRYSGQDDIAVGSPVANRNRLEIEPLIGFFTNTLVLRTDLAGNPSFRELLARVREVALGAYANQDVPFERLVEELRPPRQPRTSPFFNVLFVLQDEPPAALAAPELALSLVQVDHRAPKFDLTLWAAAHAGGLQVSLVYDEDLFDAPTVTAMLDRLTMLLEQVAEDPSGRVLDIPLTAGDGEEAVTTPSVPAEESHLFAFEI